MTRTAFGTTLERRPARTGHLKLLVALDALLREGSVSAAAASMGIQTSAMSRLLGDLRDLYKDRIFIRTGRGMSPTPLAESLRPRVRAIVAEMDALLDGEAMAETATPAPPENRPDAWQAPEMAAEEPPEHCPFHACAGHRHTAAQEAEPLVRMARYVATTAPGAGRSRPLTFEEAQDALGIILKREAHPAQIGALLMTIQYRGASPVEVAGFVQAIRAAMAAGSPPGPRPDLDWPAYPSLRWRNPPWFMHAARLTAMAGHRVLLHGYFGNGVEKGKLEAAALDVGIPVCASPAQAAATLETHGIAYLPLGGLCEQVQNLLDLFPLFQMHTPLRAVVPFLNPLRAPATFIGATQVSRRNLFRDVARLLETEHLTIIGSAGDMGQFSPDRTNPIYRTVNGTDIDFMIPAARNLKREPSGLLSQREYWRAVWLGTVRDTHAEATIINTAAVALLCLSGDPHAAFEDAWRKAQALWAHRKR